MRIIIYNILIFLILNNSLNPQDVNIPASNEIVLADEIEFGRLIGNNLDPCFVAAKIINGKFFIAPVYNQMEKIYLNEDKARFIFVIDSVFCILSPLQNHKSYSNVTEIKYYDRLGNLIKNQFYEDKSGFLANVSFSNTSKSIYFADLEMKKVHIYKYKDNNPTMSIDHSQPPPPSRLELPIFMVSNRIYIAFDNLYLIQTYSLTGEKLSHFTNKLYKHDPYTSEEIKLLPDMVQWTQKAGIHYPPVIKKIEAFCDNKIAVTRFPRPGSNQLIVDIFNNNGIYLNSFSFLFSKNDQLEDVYSSSNNFYCLIKSKKINKYKIYIYKI